MSIPTRWDMLERPFVGRVTKLLRCRKNRYGRGFSTYTSLKRGTVVIFVGFMPTTATNYQDVILLVDGDAVLMNVQKRWNPQNRLEPL